MGYTSNSFHVLLYFSSPYSCFDILAFFHLLLWGGDMISTSPLIRLDHTLKCSHGLFCDILQYMKVDSFLLLSSGTSFLSLNDTTATERQSNRAVEWRSDGATERRSGGATERRSNRWTERQSDGATDGHSDGAMKRQSDGVKVQQSNGVTDGQSNGATERRSDKATDQ